MGAPITQKHYIEASVSKHLGGSVLGNMWHELLTDPGPLAAAMGKAKVILQPFEPGHREK